MPSSMYIGKHSCNGECDDNRHNTITGTVVILVILIYTYPLFRFLFPRQVTSLVLIQVITLWFKIMHATIMPPALSCLKVREVRPKSRKKAAITSGKFLHYKEVFLFFRATSVS
jgi:hypothetical protein